VTNCELLVILPQGIYKADLLTCFSLLITLTGFLLTFDMKIKVGFGYDVHQLAEGLDFVIGGKKIESKLGSVAHSDGDVLIHAICDALLGAANKRDIGFNFPDTSDEFKGIDSKILLKRTMELLRADGWEVSNVDSTVCLEQPKMKPHIDDMQLIMSEVMQIPAEDITIKATTTEKLGFVGKQEGVAAYATTLIIKP